MKQGEDRTPKEPKTATVNLRITPFNKGAAEKAGADDSRSLTTSPIEETLKYYLNPKGYSIF
jgi:hypothetical protein